MRTSTEIRKQLKQHFSFWGAANIWLTDTEYDAVSSTDLKSAIISTPTEGDCDDHARKLWGYLRDLHLQWPVGICLLNKVAGAKTNHAMVVCACTDATYLVEAQAVWDIGLPGMTKTWKANRKKDRFYFVYI